MSLFGRLKPEGFISMFVFNFVVWVQYGRSFIQARLESAFGGFVLFFFLVVVVVTICFGQPVVGFRLDSRFFCMRGIVG